MYLPICMHACKCTCTDTFIPICIGVYACVYFNVCVLENSISPHQSRTFTEPGKDKAEAENTFLLTVSHITTYTSVLKELLTC